MATIKQRMHRFNGNSYDDIYLSANLGDVVGTLGLGNGGTGQTTAAKGAYALMNGCGAMTSGFATGDYISLIDVSASAAKKITLQNFVTYIKSQVSSKLAITAPSGASVTVKYGSTTITTYTATTAVNNVTVTTTGTYTITATQSGKTTSATATVMSDGQVISIKLSFGWSGSTTLGAEVTWCGVKWQIVDVQSDNITLAKATTLKQMTSGWGKGTYSSKVGGRYVSTSVDSTRGSYIVDECIAYATQLSANGDWGMAIDTTIYETTGKIFVPTVGMSSSSIPSPYSGNNGQNNYSDTSQVIARGDGANGGYFSTPLQRFNTTDSTNDSNRTCKNDAGTAVAWWLATALYAGGVWLVGTNGNTSNVIHVEYTNYWFRPFVRLSR